MRINKPWYLAAKDIIGFEDPETPEVPEVPEVPEAPETPEVPKPEEAGPALKSALQKERADRKALEKKLAAFEKAQQAAEDKDKTEVQRLSDADKRNAAKVEKLAQGFRKSAVESAILKAAAEAKFTDPTDALRSEVISAIGVEQDEDDPTQVVIDAATVTAAVKELAKAKKHYLAQEKKVLPPSGSKFGGGSGSPANQTTEQQQLIAQYPALARRLG